VPDEVPSNPGAAEPVGEALVDKSFHIVEKIRGLLQRLRKPLPQAEETSEPAEPTQLKPATGRPRTAHQPASRSERTNRAKNMSRSPAMQAAPAEAALEEPEADWQEESLLPGGALSGKPGVAACVCRHWSGPARAPGISQPYPG